MGIFSKKSSSSEKEKTIDEVKQTSDEEKLVELIKQKYRRSYEAKSSFHALWKECEDAYVGDKFKEDIPDYKAKEVSNFIFATIETMKPIMLTNYPKTAVVPSVPEAFEKSKIVQETLDYEWRRTKMFNKLLNASHYAMLYGTTCFGLFWNGNANRGLGDVECKIISPFNIFPNPSATNEDNADYIIYATYKNVGELCEAYKDKAERIKEQVTSNVDETLHYGSTASDERNSVLYLECYFRDYSVETEIEDELNEDGSKTGKKVKTTKRKYPNGRRTIIAGDVLLYDGENPYNDGKFPFKFWRCYELPNKFWGIGEVEMLVSPQEHLCDVMNSIIDNAGLMGNPVWILDKNCGVEKNSLTNKRGLVVRKNPGTEVRREVPPTIPAYVKDIVNTLSNDIEKISGVYDVVRGEKPSGITAAAAINALNEQAQGRIKLKVQIMEQIISELGGMWISRIQQFWETTRTIRIMGVPYNPNEIQANINGVNYGFKDISKDDLDGDFDISIVAGSTMQQNKTARLQQLLQLAQTPAEDGLPMIDRKTILESTDIENVQDIIDYFGNIKMEMSNNDGGQAQKQVEAQMQLQREKHQMEMDKEVLKQQKNQETTIIKSNMDKEKEMMKLGAMKEKEGSGKVSETTENKESEYSEEDIQMIEQIVELLQNLSPEQIQAAIEQNPEIAEIVQMILSQMQGQGQNVQEQSVDMQGMNI